MENKFRPFCTRFGFVVPFFGIRKRETKSKKKGFVLGKRERVTNILSSSYLLCAVKQVKEMVKLHVHPEKPDHDINSTLNITPPNNIPIIYLENRQGLGPINGNTQSLTLALSLSHTHTELKYRIES